MSKVAGNMKTIILVLAMTPLLFGCFWQSVDQGDLNKAVDYCGSIKNVSKMTSTSYGFVYAECFNKPKTDLDLIGGTVN